MLLRDNMKVLIGILLLSLLFFGCAQQEAPANETLNNTPAEEPQQEGQHGEDAYETQPDRMGAVGHGVLP